MSHGNRCDNNGGIILVTIHPIDKAAIDLQTVNGESFQMAERGIAGTEIIDRKAYRHFLQGGKDPVCLGGIQHNRVFHQFELEILRWQPGGIEGILNQLEQVLVLKLHAGQINRHRDRSIALILPQLVLLTGLMHHPITYRDNQAGLIRNGHEISRRNDATVIFLPADQRLNPDQATVADIHLGLIIKNKLLALQGLAQLTLYR